MTLPSMVCVVLLFYFQPVHNSKKYSSILTAVWFQKEYALPIDNEIVERFKELPWSKLAEDFDY